MQGQDLNPLVKQKILELVKTFDSIAEDHSFGVSLPVDEVEKGFVFVEFGTV